MSQSQIPDSFSQGSQQQQQSQQQQPVASSSTLPPPQPIPEPQEDYSRRYNNLLKALEVAVRKGTNKWTYDDFKQTFPWHCRLYPEESQSAFLQLGEELKSRTLDMAHRKLDEANTSEGMRLLQIAVQRTLARTAGTEGPRAVRGDEWVLTEGMAPAAITAAFNLPVHDAEHDRLQAELNELNDEIRTLAGAVQATESRREAEESALRRKVESLAEALDALQGLQADDMTAWIEDKMEVQV